MLATVERPRIEFVYCTGVQPFDPSAYPAGYRYSASAERKAADFMARLWERVQAGDDAQDAKLDAVLHPPRPTAKRSRYEKPVRPAWMNATPLPEPKRDMKWIPNRRDVFSTRRGRPKKQAA